jgi:hypothetical protein
MLLTLTLKMLNSVSIHAMVCEISGSYSNNCIDNVSRDVIPCSLVDTYTLHFCNLLLTPSTLKMEVAYCSLGQQVSLEHW